MKRAIIFDFDGTIADSLPAVIEVFEELTNRAVKMTAAEVAGYRHYNLIQLMHELGVPRWKWPRLIFKGRKMLHQHMDDVRLHPGIASAIKTLYEKGEPLYIVSSNSEENVSQYLEVQGLRQYFTKVYGGASVLGKSRKIFQLVNKERIDVAKSWYIGDETRDIIASRAVGLRVVAVTWGYNSKEALATKNPDVLATTPRQLLESLEI
jgi:phosphoglycolate phosphatase-like HAD superfamily hydrolase